MASGSRCPINFSSNIDRSDGTTALKGPITYGTTQGDSESPFSVSPFP